ncbi:MAG: ParB/RepB/Spo0J family partition protein [Bacteriovoracaceae bacterium]|nr:ParB/RepB/Spo0J family partition protein [Bacteriovoracaceae bacterium]
MSKTFKPRVTKSERVKIDLTENLSIDRKIFDLNDEKLLRGAQLQNIKLSKIEVRKQVRTKFNDDSIKELADNIRENGLIQPLVIHRDGSKFVLICGERRFRAMSTIAEMNEAPCFVLENKTHQELMAIQFSENSAREELHYIDQADSIFGYQQLTGASERKIQAALGTSKSEVHRCLLIAKLPTDIKEAAKLHNIEKYVLLEWDNLEESESKNQIKQKILSGVITKRTQLSRAVSSSKAKTKNAQKSSAKKTQNLSTEELILALKSKTKDIALDKNTEKLLKKLVAETQAQA